MKKILTKKRDITFDLKVWQCDIWFSIKPGIPHSRLPLNYANPLNLFHLFSRGIDRCSSNEWAIYLHGNKTNTNNHMVSCVYTCIFLSIETVIWKNNKNVFCNICLRFKNEVYINALLTNYWYAYTRTLIKWLFKFSKVKKTLTNIWYTVNTSTDTKDENGNK